MPPRSQKTNNNKLEFLFDVPEDQRAGIQITEPTRKNAPQPLTADGTKPRDKWTAQQLNYLYQLIELGMLMLNREVAARDFPAITEALHRQFRGTLTGNAPYLERGWNTVHSQVFKDRKADFDALARRVLG
jgi:hypothetical protein